jgi:hypothetical protein
VISVTGQRNRTFVIRSDDRPSIESLVRRIDRKVGLSEEPRIIGSDKDDNDH